MVGGLTGVQHCYKQSRRGRMVEGLAPACSVGVSPGGEVRRHRDARPAAITPETLERTAHGGCGARMHNWQGLMGMR